MVCLSVCAWYIPGLVIIPCISAACNFTSKCPIGIIRVYVVLFVFLRALLPALVYPSLQAVLLRRTKQSTINGEPIIKLPARNQQLIKVRFSPPEMAFYSQVQHGTVPHCISLHNNCYGTVHHGVTRCAVLQSMT